MSFQSFSKLPPPPRNRPKNLPSPAFMNTLSAVCEGTPNSYNMRTHVLSVLDYSAWTTALRDKLQRSPESFAKQLRFLGFRRHRQWGEGEPDRQELRFVWRGRREEYIAKDLDYADRLLQAMLTRAAELRTHLTERRTRLDKQFERSIFWGMSGADQQAVAAKLHEAIREAKESINLAHRMSGDFARDIEANLENEISLLRLLSYRHNDPDE